MTTDDVDFEKLDLATLSWLAGSSANEYLLGVIRDAGHSKLRISHGYVFQLLIEQHRTVGEIADGLQVTQQAASKVVAELLDLGYLAATADPTDARVRRIALTTEGRRAVSDARSARRQLDKKLSGVLGESVLKDARKALIALLKRTDGFAAVTKRRVPLRQHH